jgi:uncharacterized protein YdeI (YjbR/CyaY-like superfamily)
MSAKKKFRGLLEPDHTELRWVVVKVPFDVAKAWPERNRLRVKGTINGFEFRTSLFGSAQGGHVVLVNKKMQKMAGVAVGGVAEIVLEPDLEERRAEVPPEVAKFLAKDRALKRWYEQFSYSARKDIERMITEPKSAEARMRRAEQLAERMMLAMEGEREPPPILQAAFVRQPEARVGWEAMTEVQRRGHLLGIFYYHSPEAREKRAAKVVDEAVKVARRERQAK